MNYIVYHSADFDGFFSAVITAAGLIKEGSTFEDLWFIGYNYKPEIFISKEKLLNAENLKESDVIYFVDVFKRDQKWFSDILNKGVKIIVIDHHETTVEWFKTNDFADKVDLRFLKSSSEKDENGILKSAKSAAKLCWDRFFGTDKLPNFLKLISDYDIWNKENQIYWNETVLPFQYAMRSEGSININDIRSSKVLIDSLIAGYYELFDIDKLINIGKGILSYINNRNKRILAISGRKINLIINNRVWSNCYMATDYMNNSLIFENCLEGYENYEYLVILGPHIEPQNSTSKGTICNIQIISKKEESDCSKVCQMLGGGGHKGIGGATAYAYIEKPYPDSDIFNLELIKM